MIETLNAAASRAPRAAPAAEPLVEDCARVLEEAAALFRSLPAGRYAAPCAGGSPIGAHYRHVLDHYLCLFEGLETGLVHYEGRRRDPTLERDLGAALDLTAAICARLRALPPGAGATRLSLRCMAGEHADIHVGDLPTLLARELHFVMLHAIHHFSLLARALDASGHAVPEGFGLAPATRAWRASQA